MFARKLETPVQIAERKVVESFILSPAYPIQICLAVIPNRMESMENPVEHLVQQE